MKENEVACESEKEKFSEPPGQESSATPQARKVQGTPQAEKHNTSSETPGRYRFFDFLFFLNLCLRWRLCPCWGMVASGGARCTVELDAGRRWLWRPTGKDALQEGFAFLGWHQGNFQEVAPLLVKVVAPWPFCNGCAAQT